MPGRTRTILQYVIAALIPIAIGLLWPATSILAPFPASMFFIWIALIARFFGFGPALLCTAASTFTFWNIVLSMQVYQVRMEVVRLLLFIVASLVVASLSRQRSKEAREAAERLRALFDTALDAILFANEDGHYIDANPAATELLGYSRQELIERSIGDLGPAEDRPRLIEAFSSVETEGRASGEAVIVRKDGSVRDIEYRWAGNALPGIHAVMMHDITARKEAERAQHHLSGRLLQLQDEERRRIARQLHDTTAQSLAAIRLNLSRIGRSPAGSSGIVKEALKESIALTEQSIAEVRTLSYLLHPPMIDEAGLLPSLRWFVRGFEERSGITATLEAREEMSRLPPDLETAVFRIVQEALTNIQRHSGSKVAKILLERHPQHLRLEITDEGRGMPQELRDSPNALLASGVGIVGIQQRVRELGGKMEIESGDDGTRLLVTLPVAEV
jgi:PAS domain S-box-containing protein